MGASGLEQVQGRLGYQFRRPALLVEALTHTSYRNESGQVGEAENERLEFLGDVVLNLVTSEYLLATFPNADEGELSKLRARLVSEETLAGVARRLRLGEALRLGKGEMLTQGSEKSSILADALEAVLAGIYLDGGLEAAAACIKMNFADELAACAQAARTPMDFKTDLQEACQRKFETLPHYRTTGESGPDHDKLFEVEVLIGENRYGQGRGKSKKEAEQMAAKQALEQLGTRKGES
ncbi:MAG TPA: ribonuclease III [Nitrospirales bacterium]|jgi:ribonuclease-3